jgi:hypothetical protein
LTIQALTGEAATAEPRRCDYFKPDFFNGIAPKLPLTCIEDGYPQVRRHAHMPRTK